MANYINPHFEAFKALAAILGGSLVGFVIAYWFNPNFRNYVEGHPGYSMNQTILDKVV